MWSWLASFLTGPIIDGLIGAYKAKLAATNTTEKIAADLAGEEIKAEIAARAQASAIIIAEQGRWYTACIRPLFALPFLIFTFKVIVYDKVIGWGTTDALDPKMWGVFMIVVGAYFGGRSIEKVARILKR